jgi:hypothetical protein
VLDPEAIHDFLTFAYNNWSQKPMYVVLLGDGTEDYHNYSGQGKTNYVPPYLADQVDPFLGTTADENYFATVSGADVLPDLFVGRLPADTYSEANAMVDKIIDYESGAAVPDEKMLFVADNTDEAGDFASKADTVASEAVPASYALSKVYLGTNYSTAGSAKTAIINAVNAGQRFTTYLGHSGVADWADEGLFRSSDVASLNNANSYPIVLGMTCLEGSFHDYAQDAVAETLVRAADKGAIASWSATGLGVATGHDTLNKGFFDALFKQGVRRLGPAAVVAKTDLYQTGMHLDLIHTFALLGDPALDTGIEGNLPDVNNDGRVDIDDVTALQGQWHQFVGEPYDQDGNGFIDVRDFMMVIQAWN